MDDLKSKFEQSAAEVQQLPRRPDNESLLRLYALYKQATSGDVSGRRPGFTDPVGRAKYDAWARLRSRRPEWAMEEYVKLADDLKKKYQ